MNVKPFAFTIAIMLLSCGHLYAHEESLVKVRSRTGIEQKFLLVKPEHPKAVVILFAGGHGGLQLSSVFGVPGMAWGEANFLVRTRKLFADHGFVSAVIDSPSDHKKMDANWRMSAEHAEDIHAVIQALRKDFNLPVWIIGTSMGTFSASNAAIRLAPEINGLVLTSSITRSSKKLSIYASHPDAVLNMDLGKVTVPALIVAHQEDACELTPPANAEKLKKALAGAPKVAVKYFSGGKPPESVACHAKSAHGYYGIEADVVGTIADFIMSN